MNNIKNNIINILKEYNIKNVNISSIINGCYSGYAELVDGFRIGFIFGLPKSLSLTMSKKELIKQHKIYLKKYGKEKTNRSIKES